MPNRLPPLTALRAFEAAARHMSFANAAHELNVTPAALSFQIKSLEEHLGTPLFRRLNRAVELTDSGHALAPGTSDGFQTLSAAWRAAQKVQDVHSLTVTAGPAFTAKWLAPRLYEFARGHPEIELRFSAGVRMMDFQRDGIDVAIRFGAGEDKNLFSHPLAEEWITPVMAPSLAPTFSTMDALVNAPLIFDDSLNFLKTGSDWGTWFRHHGIDFDPTHGPRFSQADHAVDAALAGVGVVLGRRALVIKDIAEGRLIAPFGSALSVGGRFRFLCPLGTQNRPHVLAFREWVFAEIEKTAHVADRFDVRSIAD